MKPVQPEPQASAIAGLVRRIWLGELPLPVIFWNWAVLGGLIVNLTTSVLFLFLMAADQIVAAVICGYLFSLPYNFVVTFGVWRAAGKFEGDRRLADLAKLVTAAGMLLLSIT